MKRLLSLCLLLCFWAMVVNAQNGTFDPPPESGDIFILSTQNGLSLAQRQQFPLPMGTIDVDYNPQDPNRWLRVDNFGILRFVPAGGAGEGVYTFPPFFDGFQAASPQANKIFIREAAWSPDGEMIAFRIQNDAQPDLNQGVWFWVPIFELATDPSYQILRHCPPFCSAAGTADNDPGWRSTFIEWSSDSNAILIGLNLLGEQRRGLVVRFARRDVDIAQAIMRPDPLLYDFGHWAADGERLVVSGRDPENNIVFGFVGRDGANPQLSAAEAVGMAWVQDAVQQAPSEEAEEGRLIMLGSTIGEDAPLQIVTQDGEALTPPVGEFAPDFVEWSPDRSAVLLRVRGLVFVAQTNGTVFDITDVVGRNNANVDWVQGFLPPAFSNTPLPLPVAEDEFVPEATPEPDIQTARALNVGDLLSVEGGFVDIYAEPVGDAEILGTLNTGEELIITGGPLLAGAETWFRVQSIDHSGWIRNLNNLTELDG